MLKRLQYDTGSVPLILIASDLTFPLDFWWQEFYIGNRLGNKFNINGMVPIIELKDVVKNFNNGGVDTAVLKKISLSIYKGEFVAIIGPSGSGKSTLMNIVGCLDKLSEGDYLFQGRSIADFTKDELSELRCHTFGFVFQRYNLINQLNARENVEIPAIYKGIRSREREDKAKQLLEKLGLGHRLSHRPNQLSGGQQQRVSVARALINGGDIIVADEPTGALDSKSGKELMALLTSLNSDEGKTIIIVTHDPTIARQAKRVVEIKDGVITSDSGSDYLVPKEEQNSSISTTEKVSSTSPAGNAILDIIPAANTTITESTTSYKKVVSITVDKHGKKVATKQYLVPLQHGGGDNGFLFGLDKFKESSVMALKSLASNKLRTFLTLLGIIIGVASVIVLLAFGEGSKQSIMKELDNMGLKSTLIFVRAGKANARGSRATTLKISDAEAVESISGIRIAAQLSSGSATIRYGNQDSTTTIYGISPGYLEVNSKVISEGGDFTKRDINSYSSIAIIGTTVRSNLFGEEKNVLGKIFMIRNVPFTVVGVIESKGNNSYGMDMDDMIYIPVTTANKKLFGRDYINQLHIEIYEEEVPNVASIIAEIKQLLIARHRTEDFRIVDVGEMIKSISRTQNTLKILLACIAAISVLVGGIGVMNIMLVNVVERTREIGIRMSVGAQSLDIKTQFLVETIVVCLIGNILGIILSLTIGAIGRQCGMEVIFQASPFGFSFIFCIVIGVIFGYFPAKKAANLEPVVALGSE